MPDERTQSSPVPESRALSRRRTRISVVWVIPIVAALVGVWVAVTRIESEGPRISIVLGSAEGLEPGKTKIEYKGVEVGTRAPRHQESCRGAFPSNPEYAGHTEVRRSDTPRTGGLKIRPCRCSARR
jgi:hypothetical protein